MLRKFCKKALSCYKIEVTTVLVQSQLEESNYIYNRNNEIILTKLASDTLNKKDCIDQLHDIVPIKHQGSYMGIAHTRWATCGGKTDENSHPHFSTDKKIYLVHNGTLDNYQELKKVLEQDSNIQLTSQTDSEIIVQLIYQQVQKGKTLFESVQYVTQNIIEGQWALLVMSVDEPEKMIVARQGSPICIGLHEDSIFIASEKIAFEKYTDTMINVGEGEIIEINLQKRNEFYKNNKTKIKKIIEKTEILLKPKEGFKNFFRQEIYDQPETLNKTLGNGARLNGVKGCSKLGGLEKHIQSLIEIDNMQIVACGSSHYASLFAACYFKKLKCFNTTQCVEGSEFMDYDLPQGNGGLIVVSQSGETTDLKKAVQLAKKNSLFTIGCINTVSSQIAQMVDCGVYINCGREIAVAATKSFVAQSISLIMISIFISHHKDKGIDSCKHLRINLMQELRQMPMTIGQTLYLIEDDVKKVAQAVYNKQSLIVLGKGACSPIAKEGALKIKELTYIHAEAFAAGELKHGPLALIDPDQPKSTCIILIILEHEHFNEMKLALSEVKSRNAMAIVITDCKELIDEDSVDFYIEIPNVGKYIYLGSLTPLLPVIPLQMLTSEICEIKGQNPDKPRNLAKCVTVK